MCARSTRKTWHIRDRRKQGARPHVPAIHHLRPLDYRHLPGFQGGFHQRPLVVRIRCDFQCTKHIRHGQSRIHRVTFILFFSGSSPHASTPFRVQSVVPATTTAATATLTATTASDETNQELQHQEQDASAHQKFQHQHPSATSAADHQHASATSAADHQHASATSAASDMPDSIL